MQKVLAIFLGLSVLPFLSIGKAIPKEKGTSSPDSPYSTRRNPQMRPITANPSTKNELKEIPEGNDEAINLSTKPILLVPRKTLISMAGR